MTDRLRCLVPFCRRTRKPGSGEWICGPHWRQVPADLRAAKSSAYRVYRRRFGDNPFWHYRGGSPDRLACVEADRLCADTWNRCKAAAVEIAAGIR